MGAGRHAYRLGLDGRRISSRPGLGGVSITAHLACADCGFVGDVKCRVIFPPEQIDQKFRQAGWRVDPHACPNCVRDARQQKVGKMMAAKPSVAAMKAQAAMFQHLSEHFDTAAGRYASGWSDDRIAKDTGLALHLVRDFRVAAFGEIAEPEDIVRLRSDIAALEALGREQHAALVETVAGLRSELARVSKLFGGAA